MSTAPQGNPTRGLTERQVMIILGMLVALAVAIFGVSQYVDHKNEQKLKASQSASPSVVVSGGGMNQQTTPTNKPSSLDGKPYAETMQGMKEWGPTRTKFMRGILSKGNLAAATQGTTTAELAEQIKRLPNGAYKDIKFVEEPTSEVESIVKVEPYSYTEVFDTLNKKKVSVTITYFQEGQDKGKWKVSAFSVK